MAQLIENQKNYTGEESAEVFFRPSFTGENAVALGLRVMFNTPVNTTMNFWSRRENILKAYSKGWQGGESAKKYKKTISMAKVKAEQAFSASEYFSTVYEKITNTPGVNLQDLTGTDLAKAEEALFREAIAEVYGKDVAETVTVQYGGSMNDANAAELLSKPNVDGGLIGGASLVATKFAAIVDAAQ